MAKDKKNLQEAPVTEETASAKKENKFSKYIEMFRRGIHDKKFRYGSMSTAFVAIVVVIAVVINIIASALVERYPTLNADMSTGNRMTVNEEILQIVENLPINVTVTFLTTKDDLEATYGTEAVYLQENLAKMVQASKGKLKLSYVDLERNPDYVSKFESESGLTSGDVIVESEKRYQILRLWSSGGDSIFQTEVSYDEAGNAAYTNYNNANTQFGSAFLKVTSNNVPVIAFMNGHNEGDYSTFKTFLSANNFECRDINLLTAAEIDKEIDVLVMFAPLDDLTEAQVKMIETFMDNEGKMGKNFFVAFSSDKKRDMPNLEGLLDEVGVSVIDDTYKYVMEDDSDNYQQTGSYPILSIKEDLGGTKLNGFINTNPLIGYMPVALETSMAPIASVTIDTLVASAVSTYGVPVDADDDFKPSEFQSFPILVNAQRTAQTNGNVSVANNYTVCASAAMFNNAFLSSAGLSNQTLLLTLFRNLAGSNAGASVYITPIEVTSYNLTMTNTQITVWGLWIFTIAVPLAALVAGFVTWRRRRHL